MTNISAQLEDLLELLYMRQMEDYDHPISAKDEALLPELRQLGIIEDDAEHKLTKTGMLHAELAVRRHRLSERLIHDVLNVHGKQIDSSACEFEHSLHHGLDERICTLLGHPKTCPHGRPIPRGKCCRAQQKSSTPAVVALATMKKDESGVIAYLSSRQMETVQKLLALGVLPGSTISVMQTYPSIVFQVGHTQVAIDNTLASDIFVRRME